MTILTAAVWILASAVVFLTIAFVAVFFGIVLPMREELQNRQTAVPDEQIEAISKRADEFALTAKTNHLDAREDIVRLARRVEELEIVTYDRPTKVYT